MKLSEKGLRKNNKKILKGNLKSKEKISEKSISEKNFDKLINIGGLEELNYLVNVLSPRDINKFIEHYKQEKHPKNVKDKKTYNLVTTSKNYLELINSLKECLGEELYKEYESLKNEISFLRKRGKDVLIEDLKLTSVPFKIKLFRATLEKKDFYKIKKILEEVNKNIEIIKKEILENLPKCHKIKKEFKKKIKKNLSTPLPPLSKKENKEHKYNKKS